MSARSKPASNAPCHYSEVAARVRACVAPLVCLVLFGVGCASDEPEPKATGGTPACEAAVATASAPPAMCEPLLAAVASDNVGLHTSAAALGDGPRAVLVITPADGLNIVDMRNFHTWSRGIGLQAHWANITDVAAADLNGVVSVIVLRSSFVVNDVLPVVTSLLEDAIKAGVDVLWINSALPDTLAPYFGVQSDTAGLARDFGVKTLPFTDHMGVSHALPIDPDEAMTKATVTSGEVLLAYGPDGLPAVVTRRGGPTLGRTTWVNVGLMNFWGEEDTDFAWGRAELMYRVVMRAMASGAVLLDPFPKGHNSAFILRIEDLYPGGWRNNTYSPAWLTRFDVIKKAMDARGVIMNLAITARYVDPLRKEDFGWDTPSADRANLRASLKERLNAGATLISHGFTHQFGVRATDLSGSDFEMSDDISGEWVFLPYDAQRKRIDQAMVELEAAFGVKPAVWETPHLDGNVDTYKAAADAGYQIVTEGDTHMYPNRYGVAGVMQNRALNVPHTGGFVPPVGAGAYGKQMLEHVMPRLAGIGSPIYFFYHGYNDAQAQALCTLAECASVAGLWQVSVDGFAAWWTTREQTKLEISQTAATATLRAQVSNAPAGATLRFRVPDGRHAVAAQVDGKPVAIRCWHRDGVAYGRVVLDQAGAAAVQVTHGTKHVQ